MPALIVKREGEWLEAVELAITDSSVAYSFEEGGHGELCTYVHGDDFGCGFGRCIWGEYVGGGFDENALCLF